MADVRRRAALVVDDRDLVALRAEGEHRPQEVLAGRAEEPGAAHDPAVADLALAVELRAAVGRQRRWARPTRRTARASSRRRRSRSSSRRPARRARRRCACRRTFTAAAQLPLAPRRRPRPSRPPRAGRARARLASGGGATTLHSALVRASASGKASRSAAPSWPPAPVIEHAARSRSERIGDCVLHRCLTRGSSQQTPCSSGSAGVVLLGDVVAEEQIGQRLEAVRVRPGDVDRDGVVVADVLGERLAALPVEHDDPGHALRQAKRSSWPRSW